MAALDITLDHQESRSGKLSTLRCTITGGVVLAIVLAICWAGAAIGVPGGSHMFVTLFTTAPVNSGLALAIGVFWALAFGGLGGALIAVVYNAFGFLAEPPVRK